MARPAQLKGCSINSCQVNSWQINTWQINTWQINTWQINSWQITGRSGGSSDLAEQDFSEGSRRSAQRSVMPRIAAGQWPWLGDLEI